MEVGPEEGGGGGGGDIFSHLNNHHSKLLCRVPEHDTPAHHTAKVRRTLFDNGKQVHVRAFLQLSLQLFCVLFTEHNDTKKSFSRDIHIIMVAPQARHPDVRSQS